MNENSPASVPPQYPPIRDDEWPEEVADLLAGFAGSLNVYRVMAYHPDLLRAWVPLRRHLVENGSLRPDRLEVVILRTAHRMSSEYEWSHHVIRARKAGFTDERIRSLRGATDEMNPDDVIIARAVDQMFEPGRLSPETNAALHELVGTRGAFDLIATVGFYHTLGCIVNSFDTPLDEGIPRNAV